MLFTDINKYCLKIATDRAINTVISRPCAQCLSNILPDWSHMSNWPSMYSLYKLYGCLVVRTHVFRHLTNEQKPLYMSAVRWPEVLWNSLVFFVCNVINNSPNTWAINHGLCKYALLSYAVHVIRVNPL